MELTGESVEYRAPERAKEGTDREVKVEA